MWGFTVLFSLCFDFKIYYNLRNNAINIIFHALSALGANVNRTTANNDHTVLSLACAGGHLAVVELLLAHGADPTHRLKVCN